MGILDDAIREHLELKRQHGAESDDLERLENEAFGPAARPGDPDFAEQPADPALEPVAEAESGVELSHAEAGGEPDAPDIPDWLASDAEETRIMPPAPESAAEAAPAVAPQTAAEEARIEHRDLGDTADHPAPADEVGGVPNLDEPGAEAAAPPAPPEPPEGEIFGADEVDFGDLDLDLDEEGPGPPPPLPTEPAAEPPLADSPFEEDEELSLELGENESSLAPGPGAVSPPPAGEEDEEDEEDLLEETPDFLQDAPEGERLWFEQAPPKDFDFDDD